MNNTQNHTDTTTKMAQQQTSKEWRKVPNILITGTPGTGKTCLTENLFNELSSKNIPYQVINVSEAAKTNGFVESEKDSARDTYVLDEDRLLDWMEDELGTDNRKGFIVDYHASELFPERWFDLVIVMHADTNLLYQRLQKRGYSESKIQENVQCEIFNICEDEARGSYDENIIKVYQNNTLDDMEQITDTVATMIAQAFAQRQ